MGNVRHCDISKPTTTAAMPRQKITARIAARPDLLKRFHEQFPGHGSLSWLLEQSMLEVLKLTDGQPPLAQLVRSAIRASILRERLINREPNAKRQTDDVTLTHIHPDECECSECNSSRWGVDRASVL